ncbi:methyltransferase [Kutzneria viridogrisea]|uniref:O-methyltransferase n=1 Tax=Kutzneria viridogrisea TaxID=47990 RepID=A0ABR6BBC4_9PSEU|nr:hypothetical protein [Kutzneria viridogrisea]
MGVRTATATESRPDDPAPWFSGLQAMADLVTPMTLRVAATLRLPDLIVTGVDTAVALATKTGTDAQALARVLRHLVAVGICTEDGTGRFGLTELGDRLRATGPGDARSWLDINGAVGRADLSIVHLMDVVATGAPSYPRLYGKDFWDDLDANPALSTTFDEQMSAGAAVKTRTLVTAYSWDQLSHVADVGGGNGTLISAILAANPGLRGTLVDRPGPVSGSRAVFAAAGVTDRATAVAQSFFDPLPTGADVYLLSGVLHDWDDERATALLRRTAEAAGEQGRVVVVESLFDGSAREIPKTVMDLRMLAFQYGRARTADELRGLAEQAGLTNTAEIPIAHPHTLLEFTPAGR